jgi:glc operon protein GlcG
MKGYTWTAVLLAAALLAGGEAKAQQPPAAGQNPMDVVPEKMPFNTPYGVPISLEKAQAAVQAAVAEANKRGWQLNVAVVDSGGNLVTFARMDGAQLASIAISEHKARAAAKYRRPTKAFEEGVQKGVTILLSLDDVIASRGGIPLVEDGKLIGAIGCSGATGSQDEVVCMAGAATIK